MGHKQVTATGRNWVASVTFTGVAQVPGTGVANADDWLAKKVVEMGSGAEFDVLEEALLSADSWLRQVRPEQRRHTFTVVAYVDSRPRVVVVSNFQDGRGKVLTVPDRLEAHRHRPNQPQVFATGGGADSLSRDDSKFLRAKLRARGPTQEVMEALASVNSRTAARTLNSTAANTVSEACNVTALSPGGRTTSHAFGIDPTKGYIPPAVAHQFKELGFDLEAVARESGLKGPLRLHQDLTASSWGTPEPDPSEATDFSGD
jgi:hypothetical protein